MLFMSFVRNSCILVLLLISGFLYAHFRIGNTIFHQIIREVLSISLPKYIVYQDASSFMLFTAYNLPECLWIIAFMLSLYPLDLKWKLLNRYKALCVIIVFTILEFMQMAGWTKGTFDIIDILAVLIAVIVSYFLDKFIQVKFESNQTTKHQQTVYFIRAIIVYLSMFLAHQMDSF